MRDVLGYVCLVHLHASSTKQTLLFGPDVHYEGACENLVTNGFMMFDRIGSARNAGRALAARIDFGEHRVSLGYLRMTIAETVEEFTLLQKAHSLTVILIRDCYTPVERELLGPTVKGKPDRYPLPGAALCENGFVTYPALKRALYLGSEVNRQAQCPFHVADFHLQHLPSERINS